MCTCTVTAIWATITTIQTKASIMRKGSTSRPQITIRRRPREGNGNLNSPTFRQVQRMGNPLINELLVGTGSKDRFSMDQPKNDSQFAAFFLDPTLARIVKSTHDS